MVFAAMVGLEAQAPITTTNNVEATCESEAVDFVSRSRSIAVLFCSENYHLLTSA
jgi:hypothetical protein